MRINVFKLFIIETTTKPVMYIEEHKRDVVQKILDNIDIA